MPSSGMISDAHMGIGGDTHMALIVDGGELGKTPEYSILMCSGRMSKGDSEAHDVWGGSCEDLHVWRCAISDRQIDRKPIYCTGNSSRL
jgi:hypothetical protein